MNAWHLFTVVGWIVLVIDIVRGDWYARRLNRLEGKSE